MRLLKTINDLIFKFQRWRYGQGRYFICLEPDPLHSTAIYEIIRGRFKGTKFCFMSLNLNEENGVKFNYHIVTWKFDHFSEMGVVAAEKKLLDQIIRKILLVLLWNLYNENDGLQFGLKPGEEYEDRTSYIEEPVEERSIRAKSSSISQE